LFVCLFVCLFVSLVGFSDFSNCVRMSDDTWYSSQPYVTKWSIFLRLMSFSQVLANFDAVSCLSDYPLSFLFFTSLLLLVPTSHIIPLALF
jgi:hypothetical protein